MTTFLGVHKLPTGAGEELVKEGWAKYRQSCEGMGIKALKVSYNLEKGVAYCQTEADSEAQVREAHKSTVIPLEDVLEIKTI